MTPTATAISSLLLSLGLATCGWRFFSAFKKGVSSATEGSIGKLLTSLFFLSAAYNGIVGLGSLFLIINPSGAFWTLAASHLTLTALTFVSVYTVYYIFWPETSPRTLLGTIVLAGGVGLFYINTPLQLTPLLINRGGMGLAVLTGALLLVSLASILYLFTQLFKKTELRSIKILSLAVCGLTIASIANVGIQMLSTYWSLPSLGITIVEIALGFVGLAFLLSMISSTTLRINTGIFVIIISAWIYIHYGVNAGIQPENLDKLNEAWSLSIQAVALIGLWMCRKYLLRITNGKSAVFSTICLFSKGLILQIISHNAYYFYIFFLQIETPYPSLIDIGYLGSSIFYLLGAISVLKIILQRKLALGISHKLVALIIFLVTFLPSCSLLRSNYEFDSSHLLRTILDVAYPLAGSITIALILLAYLSSRTNKNLFPSKVLLIMGLGALAQHSADSLYSFILESGLWPDGTVTDLFYLTSYFLMATLLIKLNELERTNNAKKKLPLKANWELENGNDYKDIPCGEFHLPALLSRPNFARIIVINSELRLTGIAKKDTHGLQIRRALNAPNEYKKAAR